VQTCPACGKELPGEFPFCPFCGAPLTEQPSAPVQEERKVVTVLFCDLVGFTAASEAADPEDVRSRIRPYHARLRQEIERYGGTVEKFIGDAVMAVFGAPIAHEDDAERAVRAGLRVLEAIEELNEADPTLALQVRIGINTGEAVVALGADPRRARGSSRATSSTRPRVLRTRRRSTGSRSPRRRTGRPTGSSTTRSSSPPLSKENRSR
jgi:Adenylate and Guanylate cyclase catalytic domain/zinc-ribbon domain